MVGCGNMGFAMLQTWVADFGSEFNFTVIEPNQEAHHAIAALDVNIAKDAAELSANRHFDMVFCAVKPQLMQKAMAALRDNVSAKLYVSVAAGLPLSFYEDLLPNQMPIIRTMPNTPAAVGAGAIAIYGNEHVTEVQYQLVTKLLEANGLVAKLDSEAQMDAITAISGSGPAYVFHLAECLEEVAIELGLPENIAKSFSRQTIFGAGKLLHNSEDGAETLRKKVTSPNGTTEAGLSELMRDDALRMLLLKTAKAAHKRSVELGQG